MQTAPDQATAALEQATQARACASESLLSRASEEAAFSALGESIRALRLSRSAISETERYQVVKELLADSIFFAESALGVLERRK